MARLSLVLTLLAATPLAALAQDGPQKPASAPAVGTTPLTPGKPARSPYLSDAQAPDTVAILGAPPRGQSAAEAADKAAFNATRALKGGPRWALATTDVADGASAILDDFACVIGQRIDQSRAPALMTLLERTRLDIAHGTRGPKLHYRRLRPFVGNDAEICVMRTAELGNAFSFPSSHAAQAWTYAAIMAALMPEKATQFFVRARSYGESRIVCGLHWASDIEAGRTTATAVYAALQGDAGFRADMEKARVELGKLVASGGMAPDQAVCAREEAAAREPVL
ncbi:acid phosphatase [Methylobacterium sp. J-068]|uniref:acid phosphatase n=1 Tax=Methylobacterium sp. J-068 TaxID=2836649 RepID=UPI001FB99939|nr:phosphatase PAP2 family protein [Methylobacterium sp. J-068]MCJ2034130.1 phosphatase PAP2 family protein [Methylobacterium sp. J-068]